jgi:ABC-type lipoprotein release transport system permease subunit
MTAVKLILRSLHYFRAAHSALLTGMILVTAVLTGALILGDSVRDSLHDLSHRRRGPAPGYETLITAPHFFSETLAPRAQEVSGRQYVAGLALRGRARGERSELSGGAQLVALPDAAKPPRHFALITRVLAESLNARVGDALLITLPASTGTPDAILAHRDRASLGSLRVTVDRIIDENTTTQPDAFLAWFDLHPSQRVPATIWLNLVDLQEALLAEIPPANRIPRSPANILLVKGPAGAGNLEFPPRQALNLEDLALAITPGPDAAVLRSGNIYIPPALAQALHPYKTIGQEVYTLLLDRVSVEDSKVPALNYVVATGITGKGDWGLKDDETAVNQWTADQLQLKVGDVLQVSPYRLEGDSVSAAGPTKFKLARIVPMTGLGADATLTPTFHGLTDAASVAKWNPPAGFPFDAARVTAADEAYWEEHKAAPKVFFNLITAQRLVKPETELTAGGDSAGELTSLRLPLREGPDFERDFLATLPPGIGGFMHRPFVPDAPANTDFASLFLGLSGFLLMAALLLVVLLFRLAVEQRGRQMGLLGALGFSPIRIGRFILAEGAIIALAGAVLGIPAAVAYTNLLVKGLGTWWIGATGTQVIGLHVHGSTLALGGGVSFLAAMLALAWTARRLSRRMPLAQLDGVQPAAAFAGVTGRRGVKIARASMALVGLAMALVPLLLSGVSLLSAPLGFLLTGFLLLVLAISILALMPTAARRVRHTLLTVAAAGAFRQRTRAVLCVALMAAASFLLTSVTAFESTATTPTKPPSPTGGYQLVVTTQIPLPADLQTAAGRKLLGVPEDPILGTATFTSLLVQPGDDISCLNMTRPTSATLVGAPAEVVSRFAMGRHVEDPENAIPAAVDGQTAEYILHAGLGARLPALSVNRPIIITSLLRDSIFQSYALIPEADFRRAFPGSTRPSLILVDCPPASAAELQALLRRHLDDFGATVETTTQRLAMYHTVADSYIAAFQFLGALALLVGAMGLVVVLVRNIIQRRSELALMQALGFSRPRITLMLIIEHGTLLVLGLALGVVTALVATLPQIHQVHVLPVAAASGIILGVGLIVLAYAAGLAMHRLTPAALRQE